MAWVSRGMAVPAGTQKLFGFVAMELARVDASFGTFFGVHSGLAMGSIYLDGLTLPRWCVQSKIADVTR